MLCPRREESPLTSSATKGPDRYGKGHGLVGQPLGCSYCGSMPPDDFMAAVRDGAELGPTDKTYKVYLRRGGRHRHDGIEAKFYFQHLSEEQRQEFFELLRDGRLTIGYPGHFYVLPFFIGRAAP